MDGATYLSDAITWVTTWVLPFICVLGVLVFIHEMGHFLVARWCGVLVERFSIGFGPELVGWTDRSGTRWRVSLLPLGGYVKFLGEQVVVNKATQETEIRVPRFDLGSPDEAQGGGAGGTNSDEGDSYRTLTRPLTDEEKAGCFHFKPLPHRTAVVAAGPAANFLLAIAILCGLYMGQGQPVTAPIVSEVMPGSAAERAGLQPGDRFLSVDGVRTDRFQDVQHAILLNPGSEVILEIERAGSVFEVPVVPSVVMVPYDYGERQEGRLGVRNSTGNDFVQLGPVSAFVAAVEQTWSYTMLNLTAVGQIVTGYRSVGEIGGPVRIAHISGEVAQLGLLTVLKLMAVLSVSLGLINLFPIPMLDGGHLLYYAIEAVRGKPVGPKLQEFGLKIGLALVVGLMIMVSLNDLVSGPFWNS